MFIKKIIKEVLYLLVFIMYYLFCLVRMGEDLCIFLKIRFYMGRRIWLVNLGNILKIRNIYIIVINFYI